MLARAPFHEYAMNMLTRLDESHLPEITKLLDEVNRERSPSEPWVQEWITRLNSQKKDNLALIIQQHWEGLGSQASP